MTANNEKSPVRTTAAGIAAGSDSKLASLARRGIVALALAGAMTLVSNSASAEKIAELKAGAWNGGAYSNNETGQFSHCAASARYKSGTTLLFSVTRTGKWSMGFANDAWSVTPGSTYDLAYRVDNGRIMRGVARARNGGVVQVFLPPKSKLFSHFRTGEMLHVAAANRVMKFNLTNTSKLLQKLVRCAAHYRKAERANPFEPASTGFKKIPYRTNARY